MGEETHGKEISIWLFQTNIPMFDISLLSRHFLKLAHIQASVQIRSNTVRGLRYLSPGHWLSILGYRACKKGVHIFACTYHLCTRIPPVRVMTEKKWYEVLIAYSKITIHVK